MRTLIACLLLALLLPCGAQSPPSPFARAVRKGDLNTVKAMLAKKPSLVSIPEPAYGFTPLHLAVAGHQPKIALLLLDHGADVNAGDMYRSTPLHTAVQFGFVDMVQLLLDHQADPNLATRYEVTPLRLALANKREKIAQLLREHGGHE